jgi:hypothetical protein
MLQSQKDKRVTTVWIDPKTNFPVQIELKWTDQSRGPVMYSSIQIDNELDDDLFSLEPPEGYTVTVDKSDWPDDKSKISARMQHLGVACFVYANKHDDRFPGELTDLVKAGIITEQVLNKVLTSPDKPDGPAQIRYCRPGMDTPDRSHEVMLYEVLDERSSDDRVVVTMSDSHWELIPVQTLAQLLKSWPEREKRLSVKMTHLHWLCDRYAKEHGGQYPGKLEDLAGEDISDAIVKTLQAPLGQPDGPAIIRYRPPRADADPSTEVILYEIYDQWPEDGAVVCYADGHCEIIPDQNRFEELIR